MSEPLLGEMLDVVSERGWVDSKGAGWDAERVMMTEVVWVNKWEWVWE
jgi:hypothetical protein